MKKKLMMICLLLLGLNIGANNLNKRIEFVDASYNLSEIFINVEKQSNFTFTYSKLNMAKRVELNKKQYLIKELLDELSKRMGLKYLIKGKNISVKLKLKKSISGIITDQHNGETLIGAVIYFNELEVGTSTNAYGLYSIEVPEGEHVVTISYLGYENLESSIETSKMKNNFSLNSSDFQIEEVIVSAKKANYNIINSAVGIESISSEMVKSNASVGGELDIMKTMQLLPGVKASVNGTSQISVRGGSFDQNLILIDEAPVYNPSHALGFFSVFNPDAFKQSTLYKSYIPAKFGGRLSSVVDIRTKDGNSENLSVQGSVGLLSSRLMIESPIGENTSVLLAGRYSYVGELLNMAEKSDIGSLNELSSNSDINFYDINFKLKHKVNENNRIYLSSYVGHDDFYYTNIDDESSLSWGNMTSTLRWNSVFSNKFFMNMSLIYSNYNYSYILKDNAKSYEWLADLTEFDYKVDFDYFLNSWNHITFGADAIYHIVNPGEIKPKGSASNAVAISLNKNNAIESSLYLNDKNDITKKFQLNFGLRFSNLKSDYKVSTEDLSKNYTSYEPRFSARYSFTDDFSVKSAYTRTTQFFHLMSNSALGFPTDIWLPSNSEIKPQFSDQISLGIYKNFFDNQLELTVESYYKKMNNIIDFIDNSNLFLNERIHEQVLSGDANAYGIDFSLKKQSGKYNFMINYSYSRVKKTIEGINNGNEYSASYDKPHSLNLNLGYNFNQNWSATTNFVYSSGGLATVPIGTYFYKGLNFMKYSNRNEYRLPSYHRMDFQVSYKKKMRSFEYEWQLGLYNLYGRKNVFALFTRSDEYNVNNQSAYKMYLFSFVPFVTFNFKF
jgi:hypothetical protein